MRIDRAQVGADSPVVGREVRELDLPESSTSAVLADDQAQTPAPDTKLRSGDKLLAVTSTPRARRSCAAFSSGSGGARSGAPITAGPSSAGASTACSSARRGSAAC